MTMFPPRGPEKTIRELRRELERMMARWRKAEELTIEEVMRRAVLDDKATAWRERWKEDPTHD
jgi:hypothetical protein